MTPPSAPPRHPALATRIGATLAALAVYRAGQWVPLPGLDLVALGQSTSLNAFASPRAMTSIMALGVTPLLTAVILLEGLKCCSRRIRQSTATRAGHTVSWRATLAGALLLAAMQGYGIATGLEAVPGLVIQPGAFFHLGVAASFVGATALIVLLAVWITQHGVGHGLWVLVAAGFAEKFLQPLLLQLPLLSMGAMTIETYLVSLATWFGALAVVTAVMTLLVKAAPPLSTPEELVWTPLLAGMAVGVLVGVALLLLWVVAPASAPFAERAGLDLTLPLTALAIAAFVLARRRSLMPPGERLNVAAAAPAVAALVVFASAGFVFPMANIALLLSAVGLLLVEAGTRPAASDTASPPAPLAR